MPPDPLTLTRLQVVVSVLAVLGVTAAAAFRLRFPRARPRAALWVAGTCAALAAAAWLRFGALHLIEENHAPGGGSRDPGARVQAHRPLQFHEFFHYDFGAKYFSELGYLGLYDCTALADAEIAAQEGVAPRIGPRVRDLRDVLSDEDVATARASCLAGPRSRFSPERWASFEDDLRALQRLVPDTWWNDVVDDKGLNPPPTFMALAAIVAQAIPIAADGWPTYALTTSIDLALVVASYLALRRMLGATASALAAVTFGASFLASYGWLGGAVLRFTWVAAIVFGLAALRRGRWLAAGALLGWAGCDRVFPFAFVAGAAVPLVWASLRCSGARVRARARRAALARFAAGVGGVVAFSVAVSLALFGAAPWGVFFARMARDLHLHHVLMLGLDKVLTFRSWTAAQDFNGHAGLVRFRHWNARVDETWAAIHPLALALQLAWMAGVAWVARARRPAEASALVGLTAMFVLSSPISYYWVILALLPALVFRAGLRARRPRGALVVLATFQTWWLATLLLPRVVPDAIVYDFELCVGLAGVLAVWAIAWGLEAGGRARAVSGV
jgi:hypothetical protein